MGMGMHMSVTASLPPRYAKKHFQAVTDFNIDRFVLALCS
jgi:hypothetical protein